MNAPALDIEEPDYSIDLAIHAAPGGASRMERRRVGFPWSLGRAFASHDLNGPLRILPQIAGAGLMSGDAIKQKVRLTTGASARIEDAGATVVHRGLLGEAATFWRFDLAAESRLIFAAEPYALSPGASLSLRTEITLDATASFIGFEGVCLAGSTPASWRSEMIVYDTDGNIHFVDRQQVEAGDYNRLASLPQKPAAFGAVLVLSPSGEAENVLEPDHNLPAYIAAAPLRGGIGTSYRIAARSGGDLRRAALALMGRLI